MENIGKLNINLIRGNDKVFNLSFYELVLDDPEAPIDLRTYQSIRMDVKVDANINSTVILALAIDSGLSITGTNHNILSIEFKRSFSNTNGIQFHYDILFEKGSVFETLVGGLITIEKTVTL
jgi:hypothetical protein